MVSMNPKYTRQPASISRPFNPHPNRHLASHLCFPQPVEHVRDCHRTSQDYYLETIERDP